ncbi:ATP-dependent Clp protease ATP-binding protein ClpC [Candidatus Saccharibacteria bacterium]|nr:MAG: ATP-dependent Clp protease ATP-binding protein ClpC [Candidatus Saccharibacteria bacterium]
MQNNDFAEFVEHLTNNARGSLQHADAIARSLGSAYIGTEHLLLGVLHQETSVGAKILAESGVTFDRAKLALNLTPKALVVSTGAKGLSETAKLTLRMSWDIAQEFNQDYCGTEHILYSILSQKNARATVLLRDMNVSIDELMGELEGYLSRQNFEPESGEGGVRTAKKSRSRQGALDQFGTDLTVLARNGELDPVIGRDKQIERIITILSRRTKNNPVLIGEPGVGKTAIVEGLAQRIINEDVPEYLLDKRVVTLDLAGMIAGTKYRGEFEERLKKIVEEITSDPDIIVFIDELHLLVGAGAAEGAIDAANMLKPALARGKMRLIGATTLDEYRKHIEKDTALERRFQTVMVPEPSVKDTIAILKGLKGHYESFHNVELGDEVIEDAVFMAKRYINDRFMPDKAIDVIDETASQVRVLHSKRPSKTRELTRELKLLTERMDESVTAENYERAAHYKTRISQIQQRLKDLRKDEEGDGKKVITSDDVAKAVATMTGVPVRRVMRSEATFLRSLEKHLAKFIIGQEEAVSAVARAVRRNRSGIGSEKRPIGSFVFMGPTGVGKTELARVMAREVFGSEDALIKIDMSEFRERHSTARLVGAPAGYVGYDEGGQLTDKIRRQPYSVVLFDEIEKAHPDVFNMLLQLLEDGTLTDAKGRAIDFSNTIVILTSNLGAERMRKEASLGFRATSSDEMEQLETVHKENDKAARDALQGMMRPELINRFDSIVVFRALTKREVSRIFDSQVDELRGRLARQGLSITVSPKAKRQLVEKGYDPLNGVRPLRRVLQDDVEHMLADGILMGRFKKGDVLHLTAKGTILQLDVVKE